LTYWILFFLNFKTVVCPLSKILSYIVFPLCGLGICSLSLFQASNTVRIPREHHRFILGQKGKKLQDLELATATKISIPRADESSEQIKITGTKEGIEKAMHEIQVISDIQVDTINAHCYFF